MGHARMAAHETPASPRFAETPTAVHIFLAPRDDGRRALEPSASWRSSSVRSSASSGVLLKLLLSSSASPGGAARCAQGGDSRRPLERRKRFRQADDLRLRLCPRHPPGDVARWWAGGSAAGRCRLRSGYAGTASRSAQRRDRDHGPWRRKSRRPRPVLSVRAFTQTLRRRARE